MLIGYSKYPNLNLNQEMYVGEGKSVG